MSFTFSRCFPFSFLLGGGPAHCLSVLFMELVPKLPLLPSSFHSFHPGPIISLGQESSPPAQLQAQTLYVDEDGTNSCLLNPAIALRSSITARTASVSLNGAKPRERGKTRAYLIFLLVGLCSIIFEELLSSPNISFLPF